MSNVTNIDLLKAVESYTFHTKDWPAPTNEVIPGKAKKRVFLDKVLIGGTPFVEVKKHCGKRHLIAVEKIKSIAKE